MIVRYLPGQILADREFLARHLDRPAATIRARCTPIAYDTQTRRALYDAQQVIETMNSRQRRHSHPRTETAEP